MDFKPATRQAIKLKAAVAGPSGSGKTWGALALATQLGSRIAVIDTENESAALYSGAYKFDIAPINPPYHTDKYLLAISKAVEAKYDVLVIDSIAHQWSGTGGILDRKTAADQRGGNSFTNWAPFTIEHERFRAALLQAPIHIIATVRTKQEYVLAENDKGKQAPKKMGMAPQQREGMDYEFTIWFELQMDHRAQATKDRTGLFDSQLLDLTDKEVGKKLLTWIGT